MSKKPEPVVRIRGLKRTFVQAERTLEVLKGIDLDLHPGEVVALIGPSGAGKSTLLQSVGLLEKVEQGEIIVRGQACTQSRDEERTRIRRHDLGFVYQFHHLLPEFSALENVMLPQLIDGKSAQQAREKAKNLLELVGLDQRLHHRPAKLSGGEQQRVAIARALVNDPAVLLADEPTGNLDEKTASMVFALLMDLVRRNKVAALIATHNNELAHQMDRIVTLHEGQLLSA